MAFPHPQSGKDHYWQEDKASSERIVWKFFKRIVDITEYRNAEEDVNPAKNPTLLASFMTNLFLPCLAYSAFSRRQKRGDAFGTGSRREPDCKFLKVGNANGNRTR